MGLSAGRLAALCLASVAVWAQSLPVPSRARSANTVVTFNNQIVRIFQKHCQVCHHPGDIGPFSLMTYAEARTQARNIKLQTGQRKMPPWPPVPGFGEFHDERRLTPNEIEWIARWVDAGAPEGDPKDAPPPLQFNDQWTLGTPDLVLEPPSAFPVAAGGNDIYRCFSIPTGLLANRHVSAVEVRPGSRAVVHHVLLFEDALGVSAGMGDPQSGYPCFGGPGFLPTGLIGGWAPGNRPQVLPEGIGIKTTAGARVVMQVHYHPNGAAQIDRTRVGLFFSRTPVEKDLFVLPIVNTTFVIPAGEPRYTVTASFVVPPLVSGRAIAITPHMHMLGREIRVDAIYRDGTRRPMVYIDDWNFQWQGTYFYQDPVPLPALARLELTAVYDNSTANPNNPHNPPRDVRWGEQTTDEMCLAFVSFILD